MSEKMSMPLQLRDAYRQVLQRIDAAAERADRRGSDVLLVAVTKYATPDQMRALVDLGHADLGESRVQQLVQRAPQLNEFLARKRTLARAGAAKAGGEMPQAIRWHMVGHLQRNKVKQVLPFATLIHSVDTLRLAEEIHHLAGKNEQIVDVLLQVNSTGESQKHGIAPPAVIHMAEQIESMVNLRLRGLMTMAAQSDNPEDARPAFGRTRELFEELRTHLNVEYCNVLSMGMTDDFEVAVEEGANVVRIGRALFGEATADDEE